MMAAMFMAGNATVVVATVGAYITGNVLQKDKAAVS